MSKTNGKILLNEAVNTQTVELAIDNKRLVNIFYHGDKTENRGPRVIEIHGYGLTAKGNQAILAWQRSGASDTPNNIAGWRTFLISKIGTWAVYNETFEPRKPLPPYATNNGPLFRIFKGIHDTPSDKPSDLSSKPFSKDREIDKGPITRTEPTPDKAVDLPSKSDELPKSSINKIPTEPEDSELDTNYSIDDEPIDMDNDDRELDDELESLNENIKILKRILNV